MALTLVTGANRGLGYEAVLGLLAAKRAVLYTSRTRNVAVEQQLQDAAKAAATTVRFASLDVTDAKSRAALVASLSPHSLEYVINNAGVMQPAWNPAVFATSMATNCVGPLRLASELAAAGALASSAGIVNVSAAYARESFVTKAYRDLINGCATVDEIAERVTMEADADGKQKASPMGVYKLSKVALNRGTRILADALASRGVRVNSVDPGWCKTDLGGPKAPRTPAQGAQSILAVLLGAPDVIGSGHQYGADGKRTTW